jgi:hypothetical protein
VTKTGHYEATWIPGLDHDIDVDESLAVGFRWLAEAERMHGGRGIIVMYAKQMMGNRPLLGQAAGRWEFVSPRSRSQSGWPGGRGPVLAIWPPNDQTLELAEQLAFGSALCVISGFNYDISPWVRRTGARGLVEGFSSTDAPDLPEDVKESLDHMLSFGGHNSFLGAGAKEDAIRRLREIARRRDRPTREAIEEHLRASVETDGDGAQRAGKWYEEILEGKRHLDYRRRTI